MKLTVRKGGMFLFLPVSLRFARFVLKRALGDKPRGKDGIAAAFAESEEELFSVLKRAKREFGSLRIADVKSADGLRVVIKL